MPELQLPAIRLYYEERGQGAPILCIHATGSSGLMWEAAVQDLARLATIDKPALLVAASGSQEAFRQATAALATALPRARTVTVGGNHLVDPAGPAVLDFIREVIGAGVPA
jgi:pimeloyl-ACP methyl ester carboxylesterase